MRIEQATDKLRWFAVDHNNKIVKVFYSREKCIEYLRRYKNGFR